MSKNQKNPVTRLKISVCARRGTAAVGTACALLAAASLANAETVVRYTAAGALDSSFPNGGIVTSPQGDMRTVRTSPFGDDTILTAGSFVGGDGKNHILITRRLRDGTPDPGFGLGGVTTGATSSTSSDQIVAMGFQSSRKIIVAGNRVDSATSRFWFVGRFNWDGTLDTTFGHSGYNFVFHGTDAHGSDAAADMKVDFDGSLLVAGTFYDGFAVAKFTPDGGRDFSFGSVGGTATADFGSSIGDHPLALVIDSAGRIVLGGYAESQNMRWALARFTPAGALDTNFSVTGKLLIDPPSSTFDMVTDVAVDAGDRVYAYGTTGHFANDPTGSTSDSVTLTRITTVGKVDSSFGMVKFTFPGGSHLAGGRIRVQSDGKIVTTARARLGGSNALGIARIQTSGAFDGSFGTSGQTITAVPQDMSFTSVWVDGFGRPVVCGD